MEFTDKTNFNENDSQFSFVLEEDKEVSLQSLTQDKLEDEIKLIKFNEPYLEKAGEGYPGIKTSQQYEKYLLDIYGDHETISLKRFRILYKGQAVGQIGMHSFIIRNFQTTAEIFYWIDERFQGKGIITRACKRLQNYGFQSLGLDVIFIHCLKTNSKSENVAKRCNFILQGIAKYYNGHKYEEYYRYSKTVEAFEIEIQSKNI